MSTDICRWLFLLVFLLSWTSISYSKEIRVVCYYTNWSVYRPGAAKFGPQNINPYLCTHLIYAFGGFTKENTLKPFDKYQDIEKGGYAKFTGLKTYNKNLKTMLAIGGWNEGSSRFSPMVANPERRKALVKNAIKFLRQNHFDGLDLDWEYPSFRDGGKTRDRDNYAQLVQELREEFDRESEKTGRTRLLLTMAVPAGIEYINKGYDVPKLTKYLDWMNILSYDYHSAFEPAVNHHAPLYSLEEESEYNYDGELNIDYTIKHYLKMGADPGKLVMGIPTYGRSYTLFNPDANEIGAPADGPGDMGDATRENGYLAYYEICENVKSQDWEVVQPSEKAMGPYAYKDNQWVGYDDDEIARKKSQYVAENGLGGIMFWSIDNDDFRGTCHGKPYPIIEAAKEALISAYGLSDENLVSPVNKLSKSKTRSRTSAKTERPSSESKSTTSSDSNRRRNRIKSKTAESSSPRTKPTRRTKESRRTTEGPVYSSLELVTPSYTTPAPPSTPDQGGVFKCEDEGFYPHPKDCKKYFWCLSGPGELGIVAHSFTCPAGLYFNKAADSCDYTRNVLCNKKLAKAVTTSTTTEASTSKTTSLGSTTRVPPKITAATSRTTVFRTTTSTTEPSFEEEYEEYEDEDNSEEDPKVIKELLDLIKKAGGIEQLEKQLKIGEDGTASLLTSDVTTPSSISKTLVDRVLKNRNNFNSGKKNTYTSKFLNRNSRGPQNEGLTRTEDKATASSDKARPQYTTISRQRPAKTQKDDDEDDESEDLEDEEEETSKTTKAKQPQYVNIRRGKVSSTTEESSPDTKNSINRNKILGEDTDDDDEEDDEVDEKKNDRQSITPQYVSIRRQRPSTTEESTTSKYTIIRRGTTTEAPDEEEDKNQVKKRGSTTTTTSSKGPTEIRSRGTTTAASSLGTTADSRSRGTTTTVSSDNSTKYKTISRGTTTEPATSDKSTLGSSTARYVAISRGTTSSSDDSLTTIVSDEDLPLTTIEQLLITTPESLSIQTVASLSSDNGEKRTTPLLLEPRPFSLSTRITTSKPVTEPTTPKIAKVSESNYKLRVRQNQGENATTAPIGRTRAPSRFKLPSSTSSTTKPTVNPTTSNRARRRFSTTTTEAGDDSGEDYDIGRNFRPSDLADLSSLTAVDFDFSKGTGRLGGGSRHRRPRPSTTSDVSKETPETVTGAVPLARKLLDGALSKSRRVVPNRTEVVDQVKSSSEVTSTGRLRGSARATTPSEASSTTRPTLKSRRVIRRFRPTSTEGSRNDDLDKSSTFNNVGQQISRSTTERANSLSLLLNRNLNRSTGNTTENPSSTISTGTDRNSTEKSNEINREGEQNDDVSSEEEENIKLSESNIRENNDVNNGNIISDDKKVRRKVLKRVKAQIDGKDAEVDQKGVSTEPNIIVRTRKIVRKLKPTEPTVTSTASSTSDDVSATESTDASTLGRKRKIIRRFRPTTESSTNSGTNETDAVSSDQITTEKKTLYVRGRPFTAVTSTASTITNFEDASDNTTETEDVKKYKPSKFKYKPLSVKALEEAAVKKEAEVEETDAVKESKTLLDKPKYKSISRTTTARTTSEQEESDKTKLAIDRTKYSVLNRGISSTTSRYGIRNPTPDDDDEDEPKNTRYHIYRPTVQNDEDEDANEEDEDFEDEEEDEEVVTKKYRISRPSSTPPTISVDAKKTRILRPSITSGEIKLVQTSTEADAEDDDDDENDDDEEFLDENEDEESSNANVKNYTNPILEKQRNRPSFKAPKLTTEASAQSTTNGSNRSRYKTLVRSTTTVRSDLNTTTEGNTDNVTESQNVSTNTTEKIEESSSEGVGNETTTQSINSTNNYSPTVSESTTASILTVKTENIDENRTSTEEIPDFNETTTDQIETTSKDSLGIIIETTTNNETSVDTTTETVNNFTTVTTPAYQARSTLRSAQNRPKFSIPKRLSNNPSDSSSSTTPRSGLRFNQRTREPTTPGSTRLSSPQRPKFISKFSTTERSRFGGGRFAPDATEETEEGEEGEEEDEENRPPKVVPIRFPSKFSTTERNTNRFVNRFGNNQPKEDDEEENVGVEEEDEGEDEDEVSIKVPVTRLSPLKPKINVNRYSTAGRNRYTPKPEDQDEEIDGNDEPREEEELPSSPSFRPGFNQKTTSKPRVSNRPNGPGFRKTTAVPKTTEDFSDIDTEAVKNRNKNLFAKKRKMNSPVNGGDSAIGSTDEESKSTSPLESTTKPSTANFETTEFLTTLHHVFAQTDPVTETPTNEISGNSVVERLIEVNRIVEVHGGDGGLINRTLEKGSKIDKIGAVNRVTNIKIVDPKENEINSNATNTGRINIDGAYVTPEIAKVQEVPNPQTRGDRKLDLYSQNRVVNYGGFDSVAVRGNAEIIDGKSHINIITPRPYFSTEATTLPIEGLFQQTDTAVKASPDEELLETDHSRFVNVRILDQDRNVRLDKGVKDDTEIVPIRVLKTEDYITMKAEVVEVTPRAAEDTIRIVPIKVEMSRRLIGNLDFDTKKIESHKGEPKVNIRFVGS